MKDQVWSHTSSKIWLNDDKRWVVLTGSLLHSKNHWWKDRYNLLKGLAAKPQTQPSSLALFKSHSQSSSTGKEASLAKTVASLRSAGLLPPCVKMATIWNKIVHGRGPGHIFRKVSPPKIQNPEYPLGRKRVPSVFLHPKWLFFFFLLRTLYETLM